MHAADFHLDTAFDSLPDALAAQRRDEQRAVLKALVRLAKDTGVQVVLLPGDLFDGGRATPETIEAVEQTLKALEVPVFISPGNHDFSRAGCVYDKMYLPENVHVFRRNVIECMEVPDLDLRVWGGAFTDSTCPNLLRGFSMEKSPDTVDILCIHGTVTRDGPYNPMSLEDMGASGMDYVALGHPHTCGGLQKAGDTYYLWPGVPMGRGFDETGTKGVVIADIESGNVTAKFAPMKGREYRVLTVDITGQDPLAALEEALPESTGRDIYRIILTGEAEEMPEPATIHRVLSPRFYWLEVRSEVTVHQDVWTRAGEATLRGAFLRKLKVQLDAASPAERQKIEAAARWGIAALDGGEEAVRL